MVMALGKQQPDGWWRCVDSDGCVKPPENLPVASEFRAAGVRTVSDVLRYSSQKYFQKDCLGTRQIVLRHIVQSQGKPVEKLELADYRWLSYKQVYEMSQAIGVGLRDLGYKFGDRIALFAETRAEWLIAAGGILQHRVAVCTVYTTLSDSGVVHALNETEVPLIFTTYELLPRIIKLLPQCPKVKTLVIMEDQLEGIGNTDALPDHVEAIPFQNLIKRGFLSSCEDTPVPQVDDTAIIMYTSGSTGVPKGVELSHGNIMSFLTAYFCRIPATSESRYLAFLPLAHVLELVTELALLIRGIQIFYSSPATLTSSSLKVMPGTEGDAKIAKPTVMTCVPLVLDKVIKSISQKVEQGGWLKSFIFKKLVNYKIWFENVPFTSAIMDFLVFRKIKVELGGELKTLVVGGAPLSVQTQQLFQTMFGCDIQVGYGSTETSACVSVMRAGDSRLGHVGPPNDGVLLKLRDWEEGGYRVTDKPNPRGEVVIGGPSVAKGYFKRPEETVANFFEENGVRCFCTGDIGEIDEYGCLKIIDRLKDLVKMKHGEYVSLGSVESTLKTMPLIDNVCVFADVLPDHVVAVVVPVPEVLLKIGKQEAATSLTNPSLDNMAHLYTNRHINKVVLSMIQDHGKSCDLSKWEIPAAVYLTSDCWNPESGLVTAALKLRRKQLLQRYQDQVKVMYEELKTSA
ncbi:AMP-dependent synthetase/ligase [Trinorchestia longiramus]|nr:AMP-dependent synthetase/ligase [Trinorchestia longiramus]